jgi:hypothetical protein
MENTTKDKIRDAVIKMVEHFSSRGSLDNSNQAAEIQTVVTEALFNLKIDNTSESKVSGSSIFQSDLYNEVNNLVETYQEKVDDGKSRDTEFDKLISSLQDNLDVLLANHDDYPVVCLGESGNVEFSKALTQDALEDKLVAEVVVATEDLGGMNIQNPTSLKEAETNPRFSLNQWCYNVASTYFQDSPAAALDYVNLYKLSYRQKEDGYTQIFLQKAALKLMEINKSLLK